MTSYISPSMYYFRKFGSNSPSTIIVDTRNSFIVNMIGSPSQCLQQSRGADTTVQLAICFQQLLDCEPGLEACKASQLISWDYQGLYQRMRIARNISPPPPLDTPKMKAPRSSLRPSQSASGFTPPPASSQRSSHVKSKRVTFSTHISINGEIRDSNTFEMTGTSPQSNNSAEFQNTQPSSGNSLPKSKKRNSRSNTHSSPTAELQPKKPRGRPRKNPKHDHQQPWNSFFVNMIGIVQESMLTDRVLRS